MQEIGIHIFIQLNSTDFNVFIDAFLVQVMVVIPFIQALVHFHQLLAYTLLLRVCSNRNF